MERRQSHSIDVVFVLVLFCTFAVSVLMVLMVGASSYNDVTDSMTNNYEDRTGVAYIAEKVRHFDASSAGSAGLAADGGEGALAEFVSADGISVGTFAGQKALILSQTVDGRQYATYIYYYDGYIRELLTNVGNDLPAESGEIIIQAAGFDAEELGDGLLKISCEMEDGNKPYILLNVRSAVSGSTQADVSAAAVNVQSVNTDYSNEADSLESDDGNVSGGVGNE